MKRLFFTFVMFSMFSLRSFGQLKTDSIKPIKNFSIELLGNGFYYSLKYENKIIIQNLRYNIGISYMPYFLFNSNEKQQAFCFIPELSYLIGKSSSKLEIGAGLTYRYWRNDQQNYFEYEHVLYSNFRLGYRYEKLKSLNVYKVGFVFFHDLKVLDSKGIRFIPRKGLVPWIGLSYGRRF